MSDSADSRTDIGRVPERGVVDRAAIEAVLDEGMIAHVGLVAGEGEAAHPVVIPMLYRGLVTACCCTARRQVACCGRRSLVSRCVSP